MCDAGRQTDRGTLGGGGGGRERKLGRSAGQGNICPAFFRELIHTHTHTFPPPTHIPTLGAFTVAESHTILTWGMIHQLFRRVYSDSPLCDFCVFTPLRTAISEASLNFLSVLWICFGFNADPDSGSSPGPDPVPVRIRIWGFDDRKS